jgi:hypothetical protein
MSGATRSRAAIASLPFGTVATTSMPLSCSHRAMRPRTTTESSATRTRIRFAGAKGRGGAKAGVIEPAWFFERKVAARSARRA